MLALGWVLFANGAATARNSDEDAWVQMMEVCVTVIADQSDAIMEGFPAATALVNVEPLPERAVRHPDAPVVASAVSDGSQWFMCLVAGDPAVKAAESGGLVRGITGTLAHQISQSNDHAVTMKHTFAPVRVTCQDAGKMTAAFAFLNSDGEFRVGVVNSLPRDTVNPCQELDEKAGRNAG